MKKQNLNLENYQITELNHFEYLEINGGLTSSTRLSFWDKLLFVAVILILIAI
jgi:hypothetical protein